MNVWNMRSLNLCESQFAILLMDCDVVMDNYGLSRTNVIGFLFFPKCVLPRGFAQSVL